MSDLPESLPELIALLDPPTTPQAGKALDAIAAKRGKRATRALVDFLLVVPEGLMAMRAAQELERRKDESSLPGLYEVYRKRPDLHEDVVPILSAMEDLDGIALVVDDLPTLLAGPARLSTLAYLVKCADHSALIDVLLPTLFDRAIPGSEDDLQWAIGHILDAADDALLSQVRETATTIGPDALKYVQRWLPRVSELEIEAPAIARRFLADLQSNELIDLVPESDDALVTTLAQTICEARSPKGLVRDVEKVLIDHSAVDELFADRDDIRKSFSRVTG